MPLSAGSNKRDVPGGQQQRVLVWDGSLDTGPEPQRRQRGRDYTHQHQHQHQQRHQQRHQYSVLDEPAEVLPPAAPPASPSSAAAPLPPAFTARGLRQIFANTDDSVDNFAGTFLPGTRLFAAGCGGNNTLLAMYNMEDPDPAARALVPTFTARGATSGSIYVLAALPTGKSLAIGTSSGWVGVFEVEQLVAEEPTQDAVCGQVRAGQEGAAITGLAFSGLDRLLVLCRNGAVQVRDVHSAELSLLAMLPFRGGIGQGGNVFSCVGSLVAAVGGGRNNQRSGDADSGRVRVWRLSNDGGSSMEDLPPTCAVDLAVDANCVALRPCGTQLVVGTGDGAIVVVERLEQGGVERGTYTIGRHCGEHNSVHSIAYSPDGTLLAYGQVSGVFTVCNVDTAAVVARFDERNNNIEGLVIAWAAAGDVLAVGGGQNSSTMFRTIQAPVPMWMWTMTEHSDSSLDPSPSLKGAAISPERVAALVSGSQLVVRGDCGEKLVDVDVGSTIAGHYDGASPVTIRPDNKQVACLLTGCGVAGLTVSVRHVPGGEQAFELGPWGPGAKCMKCRWSPDSRFLVTCIPRMGLFVYDSASTELQRVLQHNAEHICTCAFDAASSLLVTAGFGPYLCVYRVLDWVLTHTLPKVVQGIAGQVCFDMSGQRVAYYVNNGGAGTVIVRTLSGIGNTDDGTYSEMRFEQTNASGSLEFSPDDRLLACGSSQYVATGKHFTLLSLESGKEWQPYIRYMALPPGKVVGTSVSWWKRPPVDGNHALVVCVAVGRHFVLVDVHAAGRAIEDGAWTASQLSQLSDKEPEIATSLIATAPHLLNIRDPVNGDTCLHHLARQRNHLLVSLLEMQSSVVTPIPDSQGQSVLCVAIAMQEKCIAKALWKKLTPSLTYVSSPLVTKELKELAQTIPEMVLPFLLEVEPSVFKTVTTFRSQLCDGRHEEVCGIDSALLPMAPHENLQEFMPFVPEVWTKLLPDSAKLTSTVLVASKVLMLPHFLGEPNMSPFHDIVNECSAVVFESKLMRLAVQYKWESSVWSMLKLQMAGYACCLLLATLATVLSSRFDAARAATTTTSSSSSSSSSTVSDVESATLTTALITTMMVVEGACLCNEAFQLKKMGVARYLSLWNLVDSSASTALLIGASAHFLHGGVKMVGAVGVALKWFGFIDYLRCFQQTGSLVRMVVVIVTDIQPFLLLLLLAVLANVSFLMVNQPTSHLFRFDGTLNPLMTGFLAMLGSFEVTDYQGPSKVMLFVFLFIVVIVLLNLLIAIMGDSYEKVKENETVHALHERAKMIVEMEVQHPSWHTFYEFMHVVEAADEDSQQTPEWEGITGRVKQLIDSTNARVDDVQQEIVEMASQVEATKDELAFKMDAMTGRMDGLAGTVDEVKDLLQLLLAKLP